MAGCHVMLPTIKGMPCLGLRGMLSGACLSSAAAAAAAVSVAASNPRQVGVNRSQGESWWCSRGVRVYGKGQRGEVHLLAPYRCKMCVYAKHS